MEKEFTLSTRKLQSSDILSMPMAQNRLPLFPAGSGRLLFWSRGLAATVRSTDWDKIGNKLSYSFQIQEVHPAIPVILSQSDLCTQKAPTAYINFRRPSWRDFRPPLPIRHYLHWKLGTNNGA